jgi:hypothetical protein
MLLILIIHFLNLFNDDFPLSKKTKIIIELNHDLLMKKTNPLLPSLQTNFINDETGELKIKYREGFPRHYRFDASRGLFSLSEKNITQKGESLSFIPISYRIFQDDILGYGLKKWVEFFFLNQLGHVCSLLFHGYSVENLEKGTLDLFYDEVNLSEVILTVTPIEKTKKDGEGKGSKYYIAEFTYQVLPNEDRNVIKLLGESLKVWRSDTLTGNSTVELSVNYHPPIQIIEEVTHGEEIPELGEIAPKT